jgi:hypothetical protein
MVAPIGVMGIPKPANEAASDLPMVLGGMECVDDDRRAQVQS